MKTKILIWAIAGGGWLFGASFNPGPYRAESATYASFSLAEHAASPLPPGEEEQGVFRCENGKLSFKSDAPLEVIQAKSNKLRGAIDTAKQTFAWSVDIKTFEGFNSPLQRGKRPTNYPPVTWASPCVQFCGNSSSIRLMGCR